MKRALLHAMRASGVFAACRRANRRKILIVTYHRFSAQPSARTTPAGALSEQLQYLRAHYAIVPLSTIERHFTSGDPLPLAAAAVTIDDGYRDAYDVAFPVLQRHGVPATLFAATDFVDRKDWLWTDKLRYIRARLNGSGPECDADRLNAELKQIPDDDRNRRIAEIAERAGIVLPPLPPPECQPLTWDQAREMAAAAVEIGSHTVTHPILPKAGAEQVARELRQSRRRLEEMLDREVTLFCYPNGDYDPRVRNEVARAGYRLAVTTESGLNEHRGSDPLALRRVHTERDLVHFIQSTSGFEQIKGRLRSTRQREHPDA